ncbi:MAG: hypothetical protein VB089_19935 [Anaerolineaceae bacterium]|nr:hypothetical protein [Anaerolineaceae bacterium]
MVAANFDGVVEAVRYTEDGKVDLVRVYERIGPAFTDRLILNRSQFVQRLKSGKRFVTGERKPYLAGSFEVGQAVNLVKFNGSELLVVNQQVGEKDNLQGVPQF